MSGGGRERVVKGGDPAEEKWLRGEETWPGLSSPGPESRVRGHGRPDLRERGRTIFVLNFKKEFRETGRKYLEETEGPVKESESWRGGWGRSEVACGRGKA